MKERIREIRELYAQCWFGAETAVYHKDLSIDDSMGYCFDAEKFAELIVLACYEHCKGEMLDKEVADTHELTYNDGVMDCAVGLIQHFGVEL